MPATLIFSGTRAAGRGAERLQHPRDLNRHYLAGLFGRLILRGLAAFGASIADGWNTGAFGRVEISGFRLIERRLSQLGRRRRRAQRMASRRVAVKAARRFRPIVKEFAPVRTGRLRRSIRVTVRNRRGGDGANILTTMAFYGVAQNARGPNRGWFTRARELVFTRAYMRSLWRAELRRTPILGALR